MGSLYFHVILPTCFTVTSIVLYSKVKITFLLPVLQTGEDISEQSRQTWPVFRLKLFSSGGVLATAAGNGSSSVLVPRASQMLLGKLGLSSPCCSMTIIIHSYLGELN